MLTCSLWWTFACIGKVLLHRRTCPAVGTVASTQLSALISFLAQVDTPFLIGPNPMTVKGKAEGAGYFSPVHDDFAGHFCSRAPCAGLTAAISWHLISDPSSAGSCFLLSHPQMLIPAALLVNTLNTKVCLSLLPGKAKRPQLEPGEA